MLTRKESNSPSAELKSKTINGGIATIGSQGFKLVLQTVATAILARILTPADFGMIAMVTAISGLAMLLKDLGLSTATVQASSLTKNQINAMFWLNIMVGLALTLIFFLISPLIAQFYGVKEIKEIIQLTSVIFLIDGIGTTHFSLLKREMLFKKIAIIDIFSTSVSLLITVSLALYGVGYWSLVLQAIFFSAISTTLGCYQSGWVPSKPAWDSSIKRMIFFGTSLTVFNIINYLVRNIDNVLIGAYLGASQLGFYSKAYNLLLLPIRQVSNPLAAVSLPALSKLKDNFQDFRLLFLNICETSALITFPIVAYAFVDADLLVEVLLGHNWLSIIETFRYLSPAAMFGAVAFIPAALCISLGRPNVQLKWSLISSPFIILGFIIGLRYGINGVAIAFSLTYSVSFLLFIHMSTNESPVTLIDILKYLSRPLLVSVIAGVFLYLIKKNYQVDLELSPFLLPIFNFLIFVIFVALIMLSSRWGRNYISRLRRFAFKGRR